MPNTYADLVSDALGKIRMVRGGDPVNPDNMAFGLRALNRRIDAWNAVRPRVFRTFLNDFTLTPNHTPHTIGPSGADFTVTGNRPVSIDAAELNIGGGNFQPIRVMDWRGYAAVSQPSQTSTYPFLLYYDPAFDSTTPVGNCYFWPIGTSALTVRLWIRQVLTQVAETDNVVLPPAYELALLLSLAEDFAEDFGQDVSPKLEKQARLARAAVDSNNRVTPYLDTRDSGVQPANGMGDMTLTDFLSRGPY